MKNKIFLIALLFLAISFSKLRAESDTLWTTQIGSTVRTVKFSPDGEYVYAAAQGRGPLKLDAQNGNIIREFEGFKFERERSLKYCMQLSSDGKYLYAADNGKFVYKYDTESNELIDSIRISNEEKLNPFTWTLGLSEKYLFVFYAFTNANNKIVNEFNLINLDTKLIIKSLNIADVTNIEVHENKNLVAISTAKDDNTEKAYVLLYDLEKLTLIHTFDQHTSSITDLSFSPDGSLLASCDDDNRLKIWDIEKKEIILDYYKKLENLFCLELISNNLIAMSRGEWEKIKVKTNEIISQKEIFTTELKANDFMFFKNEKVIIANFSEPLILLKADKLTSIKFNINNDKIYPNPTNNNLIIPKSYFGDNFIYLSIIDLTGKEIYRLNKSNECNLNEDLLIDVTRYLKGSYIVQIFSTTNIQTLKFIKE